MNVSNVCLRHWYRILFNKTPQNQRTVAHSSWSAIQHVEAHIHPELFGGLIEIPDFLPSISQRRCQWHTNLNVCCNVSIRHLVFSVVLARNATFALKRAKTRSCQVSCARAHGVKLGCTSLSSNYACFTMRRAKYAKAKYSVFVLGA